MGRDMPKGLKQTSEIVQISARATETAANTFLSQRVDLQLDVLSREVFVVVAIDINPALPDAVVGTDTAVNACISTTERTTMGFIDDTNVLATMQEAIQIGAMPSGVPFSQSSLDSPPASLDYIGIIATNDFFLSVEGTGNAVAKSASARVWGFRAVASGDVFAALTQSELLSA